MANFDSFNDAFDFGSFIHYPEENMESSDFALPSMDTSAESMFSDMQLFPEMNSSECNADFNLFDSLEYSACDLANQNPFTAEIQTPAPQADDFRYVVDSWASADQRLRSTKQKRRDAAIDLHLQRFMTEHSDSQIFPTDSDVSPSGTPSITSSYQSPGDSTPASLASGSDQSTGVPAGGRELIFDLNLNTATQLPKKQKKRTKAQIEDYINARRNGACIKHKKQHKKCNCHEKLATKKADLKAKRQKVAVLDRVPTPELILNTTTPSSQSVSSFSQSPLSQLDNVLFGDDINTAMASLSDLYSYVPSDAQLPVDTVFQDYVPKEVSTMHHLTVNTPRSSSSVLPGASSLTKAPAQGVEVNGSSQIGLPVGLSSVSNTGVEIAKKRTVRRGSTDIQGPNLDVVSDIRGGSDRSPHSTSEHGTLAGASSGLPQSRLVVQSPTPSLPVLPVASSSSVSQLTSIQTQASLAGPVRPAGPSRQVLPTTVSETLETMHSANVRFKDVYSAAMMQQSPSDFAASLFAMEWVSRLSTTMAMHTLQVILACRPQLFQFLSEQAMGIASDNTPALPFYSDLNPVQTVSAGLIGCA